MMRSLDTGTLTLTTKRHALEMAVLDRHRGENARRAVYVFHRRDAASYRQYLTTLRQAIVHSHNRSCPICTVPLC